MYFPKNSYLIENFNDKLIQFDAAGLIQYWASAHMDMKYLNFKVAGAGRKQITLHNLSGILQILLGGMVLSFAVFVCELFWKRIRKFWLSMKKQ